MKYHKTNISSCCWEEVRNELAALDPVLAKIIDEVNPSKQHKIYKARYSYGQKLVHMGKFQLPTDDLEYLIPLSDPDVPVSIQADLSYNAFSNPVTFVVSNSLELFIELSDRLITYSLIPAGSILGLSRILDTDRSLYPEIQLWGLTAGARSIFMLPSISESISYNRLRKAFYLKADKPQNLLDQWIIFQELAKHPDFKQAWHTEVLFFSKEWFNHFDDSAWNNFYYYLTRKFLNGISYWRNQYLWNLLFTRIHQKRNIKPSPFIIDITKHLLAIGVGAMPGFAPIIDDSVAPVQEIQKIFIDHYGLKQYAPIVMGPRNFTFSKNQERPVYFSLQHCTALELGMKSSERATALTNLYEISSLLVKYLDEFKRHDELQLLPETLHELVNKVNFDCFHSQTGAYDVIRSTEQLPLEDSSFLSGFEKISNSDFPYKGHFINGCVRISQR